MSLVLTALLFVLYYGYIILIATNRALVSRRLGETMTWGIPMGAAVIVWLVSWLGSSLIGSKGRLERIGKR